MSGAITQGREAIPPQGYDLGFRLWFQTFSKHSQKFWEIPKQTRNLITKKGFENRFFFVHGWFRVLHACAWTFHGCAWMFFETIFREEMIRNSFHVISGFDEA